MVGNHEYPSFKVLCVLYFWNCTVILSLSQQEAVNSLRKSQSLYMMRKQEYEKAREQSSKVESDMLDKSNSSSVLSKMDKRKKLEEDAMHKVGREITQSPKGLLDLRDDFQLMTLLTVHGIKRSW